MEEIWKDIKGFDGRYQVSDKGRVKSVRRRIGYGIGYVVPERILLPNKDKDGYLIVSITKKARKNLSLRIHWLVVTHFITSILPSDYHICHKDDDITNNRSDNLYVGNAVTNALDKYRHGRTKLSIEQVHEIRESTELHRVLADRYGVRQSYISRIKSGKRATTIPVKTAQINEQVEIFKS